VSEIILEDQIVLFIDLLGFSESSSRSDPALQASVLSLLTSIASLKSEFVSSSTKTDNGTTHSVRPSVSTFSDHIVASYSLSRIDADTDDIKSLIVMAHLSELVAAIAVAALSIGFLVRGGVAFGKLYHRGGVVFGQALLEAVALESRTAIYPRIVLSDDAAKLIRHRDMWLISDFDGVLCINYYRDLILKAIRPGDNYVEGTAQWFNRVCEVLHTNLSDLRDLKQLNHRAKWCYFARRTREVLESVNPQIFDSLGIDLTKLPKSQLD
jgi:hypothetical protein